MRPSVIIFDAFGTLIERPARRINPYDRLVQAAPDRHPFMTRNVPIDVFAEEFGLSYLLPLIRLELVDELRGYRPFSDVDQALRQLRASGRRVAVCSNLAYEYGQLVRELLPNLDGYIFSYEVGFKKPNPAIYQAACDALSCKPGNVLFIGDSPRADVEGPEAFGMKARLIDRKGGQALSAVLHSGRWS